MNKKFIWLIVSCLMVAALVLASCAPAVVEEKEAKVVTKEPEKKAEVVEEKPVEVPQYGGKITALWIIPTSDPQAPDIANGFWQPLFWLPPIQEKPIVGDFEKYGPRGTNEYAFQTYEYIPGKFQKGQLLESWEISPDKTTWHIRQGVYWQGRDVMESRELVAEDVVDDLLYFLKAPAGKNWSAMTTGEIYATDKYTVVIETPDFNAMLMKYIGYEDRALISPPETEGSQLWEEQVGTGPFMFKEYIVGTCMKYVKNPSYRGTTTINGVEYQLPFIDEMVWPIIPDYSTQMAALRTGKLDFVQKVSSTYWPSLDKTAGLLSAKYSGNSGRCIYLNTTKSPFDNVNVRRALMIGTDLKAFGDVQGVGPLPVDWYPLHMKNPSIYIPLAELPAETRLIYDYNPDLAKQMLADVGYPDGFNMVHEVDGSDPRQVDAAAMLKDQWAKIGVDVELVVYDGVTFTARTYGRTYIDSTSFRIEVANFLAGTADTLHTGTVHNFGMWSNERFDELSEKMRAEIDPVKRIPLIKEAGLLYLKEIPNIPTNTLPEGHFWWPWIKNYYGEVNVQDNDFATVMAYVWIDQALKKEMGY